MFWLQLSSAALAGLAFGGLAWLAAQYLALRYCSAALATPAADDDALASSAGATMANGAVVATAMALWGGWVGWRAPGLPVAASALVVTALLLCITLVDLQTRRIPNVLVLALLAWSVAQMLWLGQPALGAAAVGLLVAGGTFFLLAHAGRGFVGLGDVKLVAALGALLGYPAVLAAIFAGVLAGGVAAAFLLLTRRAGRKDPFAYGPYLALGAWLVYTRVLGLWPG